MITNVCLETRQELFLLDHQNKQKNPADSELLVSTVFEQKFHYLIIIWLEFDENIWLGLQAWKDSSLSKPLILNQGWGGRWNYLLYYSGVIFCQF